MITKIPSTRRRGRPPPGVKDQSSLDFPSHRAHRAASRIHKLSGMWPNELCKGFVPDMWGIRLIEGLSALVRLVVSNRVDLEEVRRRLKGDANHHPRTKYPQLRKSDILKVRKWLRGMGIDTKHTNPNESTKVNDHQSDDEMGYSDATEADSEPVDEIVALGLPEDQVEEDTDEEEETEEQVEELREAQEGQDEEREKEEEELEDKNDLDCAAPKKQSTPRERRRSPAKEVVQIEDDESDEETVVDPSGGGFMPNDSPEPAEANGQSRPDYGTSTPNSVSTASRRALFDKALA
ncbi:hypothetical protein FBULB1_7534 [Fusarium bulbicola]|nr:hypothetical protein FBULB1_7534 [Fusarium bulbicola]